MCVWIIKHCEETDTSGLGGGSGIAKVNLALSVIYWHITRLTPLMRVCERKVWMWACTCSLCFFPLCLVLYRCSLSCAITLCPSSLLLSRSDNLIKRPCAHGPPSFFITLLNSRGRDTLYRVSFTVCPFLFLSLSYCSLISPSLLYPPPYDLVVVPSILHLSSPAATLSCDTSLSLCGTQQSNLL